MRSGILWSYRAWYAALILLVTATLGVVVGRHLEKDLLRETEARLLQKAHVLRALSVPRLRGEAPAGLQDRIAEAGREAGVRLSVIGAGGEVIADSGADPSLMDDHDSRPEILEARDAGVGIASRFSRTLQEEMMYVALPVRSGDRLLGYVRVSMGHEAIARRTRALRWTVAGAALAGAGMALVIGLLLARGISRPLRRMREMTAAVATGRYDRRVRTDGPEEIRLLASGLNEMAAEMEARVRALEDDRDKLQAILGGMGEGVVAVDGRERIVHMSGAAGRLLDADPGASIGRPIWEVSRVRDVSEALGEARREGREVSREIRLPGGRRDRVLDLHAAPLREPGGRITGGVAVLHDVTELRRLERVRTDFVANVSHELKTPLAAIRGLIETILDDGGMDHDTRRRFLGKLGEQARRLSALVTDLLTLSRLEREGDLAEAVPLDLRDLVRESVRAHAGIAEERGLRLETEAPSDAVGVRGDPQGLRQVVDNLLGNAIQYTPEGGRIRVRLGRDGGAAVVEVQDTGIGIEPREQDRIFERFYRVDRARSRELGGTGLGLSIVKHVVAIHGGTATVESTPGKGSTFRVRLPGDGPRPATGPTAPAGPRPPG